MKRNKLKKTKKTNPNSSLWPTSKRLKEIARDLENTRIQQGYGPSNEDTRRWMES